MDYVFLGLLWCIWCTLHSFMISVNATKNLKKRLGTNYRFYRLFYNLISLITLLPVVLYSASIKGQALFEWEGFFQIIRIFLLVIVLLLFFSGLKKYDMLQLLGVRQIKTGHSHALLSATGNIDTSGIFKITRHPWYLAVILFVWLRDIYAPTLVINIILTVYIVIGTILEENKIIAEHGNDYRNYQKEVSMLIPFKWLFSKILFK